MSSFACYRLPYENSYTVIESDKQPKVLSSLDEIGGEAGFVISPFKQTEGCPIILISPDRIKEMLLKTETVRQESANQYISSPSHEYAAVFDAFHDAVVNNQFHKLVLARSKTRPLKKSGRMLGLFEEACIRYPRLTIILFSTPLTGTWLIASPEILIEGKAGNYHTVALAGTMTYQDGYQSWNEKNKQEQHIVEQYIEDTINPLSTDVVKDGPVTMRAGCLVHLRTDFRFHLKNDIRLGAVLSQLHPTPAVCGLPKQEACDFILNNEHLDRRYYSGFSGPVNINGETHLYVSLRCAEVHDDNVMLYAGGGIMPDSQCQSEWTETEQKMNTIKNVLK